MPNLSIVAPGILSAFRQLLAPAAPTAEVRRPTVNWHSILAHEPYYLATRQFEWAFERYERGYDLDLIDFTRTVDGMQPGERRCYLHFVLRQLEEATMPAGRRRALNQLLQRITQWTL